MAVTSPGTRRPSWPDEIDPALIDLAYEPFVDELTLYFGDRSVLNYSDPIETPDGGAVMVMIGMDEDDASTDEIVGIHVYPLAARAVLTHPAWRSLTNPSPPAEAVAAFVADVADLFERYWRPAPPIEEQLARFPRADRATGIPGA